jgi:hypothetical protein
MASPTSIPVLHRALTRLSAQAALAPAARAQGKAALHEALGALGSRIALYDLREMLEARPARAWEQLLAVAQTLGDASLVPALTALATDVPEATAACARALKAIVAREGLRRNSRAVKAVKPEHRAALDSLWSHRLAARG